MRLEIRSGTAVLWRCDARVTQAAGQTRQYTYSPAQRDDTAFTGTRAHVPIPPNLYLSPGQTIRIAVTAGRLDDNIQSIIYFSEEWLDG